MAKSAPIKDHFMNNDVKSYLIVHRMIYAMSVRLQQRVIRIITVQKR